MSTPITAQQFQEATGYAPVNDDLERSNCPQAGQICHWQCGWDHENNLPYFMSGRLNIIKPDADVAESDAQG